MKYSYYNPNLSLTLAIKAIFSSKEEAKESIVSYFKKITGKEYILITNSCRTALYLAYKSIEDTGEVITSPLTCKVAIDPIEESGNKPVFADINIGDLNINAEDIIHRINKNTVAIQAIHLGGICCDMERIKTIAEKNNLCVIEDCAQSMGARHKGKHSGSFGDISCFSLAKNAYGIGGGILATSSADIYRRALELNKEFKVIPSKLTIYRFIRNIAETYRKNILSNYAIRLLLKINGDHISHKSIDDQLNRISSLQLKVSAAQISRFDILHHKRKFVGSNFYKILRGKDFLFNSDYDVWDSSFTKFFVYNPAINVKEKIIELSNSGIEAMHLEQKRGSPYQQPLINRKSALDENLYNYLNVHDSVISLPIQENFSKQNINVIVNLLIG